MKRVIVIISVFLGCIIVTLGALLLALQSERVQTAIVATISDEISQVLKVESHIDRVSIRLPIELQLDSFYLSDQQGDSLLSVPKLRVRMRFSALKDECLRFSLIQMDNPSMWVVQDSATTNFDFLIRAFQSPEPKKDFAYQVDCQQIILNNAQIHYYHVPSDRDLFISDFTTNIGLNYKGPNQLATKLRKVHLCAKTSDVDGYVQADLHGSLDTIWADQLKLVYKGKTILKGQASVEHPLQPHFMYTTIECTDLYANSSLVNGLVSEITHQPFILPEWTNKLGTIQYRGTIAGTPDDLSLRGSMRTSLGTLITHASIHDRRYINAAIATRNMNLGSFLHNPEIGVLSAVCSIGTELETASPRLEMLAKINKLEYKDYPYSNISFEGTYANHRCHGHLTSSDPNVAMELTADVCSIDSFPKLELDLSATNVDLAALHLSQSNLGQRLALHSSVSMSTKGIDGNLLDKTTGTITIDSLAIEGDGRQLLIPSVELLLDADDNKRQLLVQSPVLNVIVNGEFQWSTLPTTIKRMVHHCLPSFVDYPRTTKTKNNLDFSIEFPHINDVMSVLSENAITFSAMPVIQGYIHDADSTFSIQVQTPEIIKRNSSFRDASIRIDNVNAKRSINGAFYVRQHIINADSIGFRIDDLIADVQMSMGDDSLHTALQIGSMANRDSLPDILVETTFAKDEDQYIVHSHVLPTAFTVGTEDWHVMDSHVLYSSRNNTLSADSLMFFTRRQMMMIDGCMSANPTDSLRVQLRDIDLGYILSATKVVDAIDFRGKITGWFTLYGAFSNPQFEANLEVPHGMVNGIDMGQVRANAHLDHETGRVMINGSAVRDNIHILDVKGYVIPQTPAIWDLQLDAKGAPLTFVNYWTKDIINKIEGDAYGRVHIYGHNRRTWITTRAYAKNAGVTVPATGARYYFSDSIFMDTAYIAFPSVHVQDAQGHRGFLSGRIDHHNFKNFRFKITADCNELLAVDLPASSDNVYYGKAYATGKVSITGDDQQTRIDARAMTAANTDFYLSLATASSASNSEFITFKQPTVLLTDTGKTKSIVKPDSHFLINLDIDVQPSARVHLVLDEYNGDGIVGRGQGNIRFNMDASTGDMQLLGTYTLRDGTFSYTVGNLVHRDFSIAEGSTISWVGDATNPKLDIEAKYRCTASLRDLFGSDVSAVTNRPSIPVDCIVRISGEMNNMILKFGIEFPQSDESVSDQILAVISTEAMLMRQVVYLLVFNRFYTPDNLRNSASSLNDAYSLVSSTVTGQINSWLNKLTNMVNVGFNMRKDGNINENAYETEANIQIQPIPRLTINGNVGYRTYSLTNQPIFGDADVEYELTADGQFRAKIFTHSVDQYSLHQSGMQEGVGFLFRHDFNPGDAKKHREMKQKAKQAKQEQAQEKAQ